MILGQVIKKGLVEKTTSEQRQEEWETMNHANVEEKSIPGTGEQPMQSAQNRSMPGVFKKQQIN